MKCEKRPNIEEVLSFRAFTENKDRFMKPVS